MKKIPTAALAVSALSGCDVLPPTACNTMYAPDTVVIDFSEADFGEGRWRIEIDDISCTLDLPADPGASVECEGDLEVWGVVSDDGLGIDELNVWEFAPESFEVTLYLDDELYDSQSFSPEYEVDEPNGRGCGERSFAEVSW